MEVAFGVPPMTMSGKSKDGVFAFGKDIFECSDVGGIADGEAGTGVTSTADDEDVLDANLRFASWSST